MHFEAGNGLITPLKKRRECEFGNSSIQIKLIYLNVVKKIICLFLHMRAEQLNAFHKLCKDFYCLASTSINPGLSVKGNHIQNQTNEKTRC